MFSELNTKLTEIFSHFSIDSMAPYMLGLKSFLVLYLAVLISYKGYLVLAGRYPNPVRTLIYEMIIWSMIVTVAFNINNWWTLVSESIDGIHLWAGGGTDLYNEMDALATKTSTLADICTDISSFFEDPFIYLLIWGGFLLAAVGITFILIGTTFTLKLLILVAPLAIAALLFGWIKNIFTNWLILFISNTLTVILVGIIVKFVNIEFGLFVSEAIEGTKKGDFDVWLNTFKFLVFGLFIGYLTKIILSLAASLAGGGIESISTSAARGMANAALNPLESAGRGAASLAGRSAKNTGSYVSNKIKNKFRKGK